MEICYFVTQISLDIRGLVEKGVKEVCKVLGQKLGLGIGLDRNVAPEHHSKHCRCCSPAPTYRLNGSLAPAYILKKLFPSFDATKHILLVPLYSPCNSWLSYDFEKVRNVLDTHYSLYFLAIISKIFHSSAILLCSSCIVVATSYCVIHLAYY